MNRFSRSQMRVCLPDRCTLIPVVFRHYSIRRKPEWLLTVTDKLTRKVKSCGAALGPSTSVYKFPYISIRFQVYLLFGFRKYGRGVLKFATHPVKLSGRGTPRLQKLVVILQLLQGLEREGRQLKTTTGNISRGGRRRRIERGGERSCSCLGNSLK